jgi:short-subunit dehydrogenase
MVARREGAVLNVASAAAFFPGPLMAVYYASKAYVVSFSEALAEELRGSGVTVTALCPGPVHTGFAARAAMEETRVFRRGVLPAETVAEAGYRGLVRGKRVVIPGRGFSALIAVSRLLPRGMLARAVRRNNERR